MTQSTNTSTNSAGCSPCTPEAHQRASEQKTKGVVCGYVFNPGHQEKHYLVNPKGRSYSTAMTRNKVMALLFQTEEAAHVAIEKKLDAGDRGQSMGYCFISFVEPV